MIARLRTMTRQWLFPGLGALDLVGTVMGDATDSTFDIIENQYQDGFKGATGYLPVFHPTGLSAAETTMARVGIYSKTPDPSNISLEFPDAYQANIVCFGRAFDPRGPYAQPPQAPYLIPGNIAVIAFGDAHIPGGGMYIATSPAGFNDTVGNGQQQNLNPAAGPVVTLENKVGIYQDGISNRKC